jgi:hypothetical protein
MARHLVSYTLGDRATGDDIHAIETAVEQNPTFKASMKVALQRYAARWRDDARAPDAMREPPLAWTWPGPQGGVAVSPALRSKLDEHCSECHDEVAFSDGPDRDNVPFDFTGGELPRQLLVSMAEHVAFGMMPKDQPLDPREREEVVGLLIDTLWSAPSAQREARRYYLGGARGLPAHQIDNALHLIDHAAGVRSDAAWGALERGVWSDQSTITPGFVALTGLEAVRACLRANEAHGTKLEDCLVQATSLHLWSRWPARSNHP